MGNWKVKVWAGPLLTPFLSVWPCRSPWESAGFPQPSASDQGLSWYDAVPQKGWAGGRGGRRALHPGKSVRVVGMAWCPEPREQLSFVL